MFEPLSRLTALLLLLAAGTAYGAAPRQMTWSELSSIVGKNIRVLMPDGAVIAGKAIAVEPEAMVVQVRQTSNRAAYPKGEFRVPRSSLRAVEIRRKSVHYRILGTTIGTVAGLAGGAGAAWVIDGLGRGNGGSAAAALIGITAAGAAGGYFIGNAADRKSTTILIRDEPGHALRRDSQRTPAPITTSAKRVIEAP